MVLLVAQHEGEDTEDVKRRPETKVFLVDGAIAIEDSLDTLPWPSASRRRTNMLSGKEGDRIMQR